MRNKLSKFTLAAGFVLALAFTLSCSSDSNDDHESYKISSSSSTNNTISSSSSVVIINSSSSKQETYYMETGTVSETAYNYVKNLDQPAEDLVTYCHRYPVSNDKYAEVESGLSRAKLEEELENIPNKVAVLRSLDKDGAVLGLFKVADGSTVFLYIEKEYKSTYFYSMHGMKNCSYESLYETISKKYTADPSFEGKKNIWSYIKSLNGDFLGSNNGLSESSLRSELLQRAASPTEVDGLIETSKTRGNAIITFYTNDPRYCMEVWYLERE